MRRHVVILLGAAVLLVSEGCGRMNTSPSTSGPAVASAPTSGVTQMAQSPSMTANPRVPLTPETATAGATEAATPQVTPLARPCGTMPVAESATTVATATANAARDLAWQACNRRRYMATETANAATAEQAAIRLRPQLQQHWQQWQAQHIRHYRFQMRRLCYCPLVLNQVLIEVVQGKRRTIRLASTPTPTAPPQATTATGLLALPAVPPGVPTPDPRMVAQEFSQYDTVDKLFGVVQAALDRRAQGIRVTYDPTFGYPTRISIDENKVAVDDEISLTISRFEVLK